MSKRRKNYLTLLALIVLPAIWFIVIGLPSKISTNLLDLVPAESLSGDEARSMRAANAVLARNVFLSIDGLKGAKEWRGAATLLEEFVVDEPAFGDVVILDRYEFSEPIWEILQEHKLSLFLAKWTEAQKADFGAASPDQTLTAWLADQQVERIERFLESPEGTAYAAQIPSDPLLLLPEALGALDELQPARSSQSGDSLMAWITLTENPFDSESQEIIADAVSHMKAKLVSAFPGALVETAGVYALAQESEVVSKREVTRLNVITAIIIFILLGLLLRQIRSMLMVLVPLTAAIVWALTIGILLFGQIHILALGMSAVLLGLAVDYGIHAEAHRALRKSHGASPWAAVRLPLVAGCLSTCIGFAAMVFTPIPALEQVAVLVPSGLLAALGAVYLTYSSSVSVSPQKQRLAFDFPRIKTKIIIVLSLAFALVSILVIMARSYLYDSVVQFQLPAMQEQKRLGEMLERMGQGTTGERWVLYAPTATELIQSMSELNARSETPIFPVAEVIAASNDGQLTRDQRLDFVRHFQEKLSEAGYDTEAFQGFIDEFTQTNVKDTFEDSMSQLADALQGPLAFTLGRDGDLFFSVFTILDRGFTPPSEVSAVRIAEREHLDHLLASASHGILNISPFAFVLVAVLLMLFFGFKDGLIVALLPLWAVLCGNAILAVWSPDFSLMRVIGTILAYCLALDYAVFAVSERGKPLISVRISAITSASAFAVLTTSSITALSTLGWSVCLSILVAWLGAECVNVALNRNHESSCLE